MVRSFVSLAVIHINSRPATVMRWCVFPGRCGTSSRVILGDRRPSVALFALHVHVNTHKITGGQIVISHGRFQGVCCKQIIVHLSAEQEKGQTITAQVEQNEKSHAKQNKRKHQSGPE